MITCTLSPVRNVAMPIESDAAPLRVTTRGEPTTRAEAVLKHEREREEEPEHHRWQRSDGDGAWSVSTESSTPR